MNTNLIKNLRGSVPITYTLAEMGCAKLRKLLSDNLFIQALGCITGLQAVQCAKAGLRSIYCSGWQLAAEQNTWGETYPDMSLYPTDSIPLFVRRLNKALQRADQIECLQTNGNPSIDYWLPIVVDLETGLGVLQTYELVKQVIEAGAAAFHLEDQSIDKRCGHLGGKTLIPTDEFVLKLKAANLATEVCNTNTLIIARTDAESAKYCIGGATSQNGYGTEAAIRRSLIYAPYADLLWMETSKPDLIQAKEFANAIHEKFPGKWLAYNLSPSFLWTKLNTKYLMDFQLRLGEFGYKFQFVTLAGWHSCAASMYELAKDYLAEGMLGYTHLQNKEELLQKENYTALKHQREVGTEYFDKVLEIIIGNSDKSALVGSTEDTQFYN
jgi:isocitrate lyase